MSENSKIFVAYLTSGLGNRLRPLASALAYCALTGRQLRVYWDQITPNGCLTPLDVLFKNRFEPITLAELETLSATRSVGLFTEKGPGHGVQREAERFGRPQLLRISARYPAQPCNAISMDSPQDIVVVYDNNYLSCIPTEESIRHLRSLDPSDAVRERVAAVANDLGLSPAVKGVHARGTDFGLASALELYAGLIKGSIAIDQGEKFFLSTDDKDLEQGIINLFPANVLTRSDRLHLTLNEGKSTWFDPDSFTISEGHGLDALIDIYLLSCVNLVVFHPGSTFGEISRHLHGALNNKISSTHPNNIQELSINLELLEKIYTDEWLRAISEITNNNDDNKNTATKIKLENLLSTEQIATIDYILKNYRLLEKKLFVDNSPQIGLLSAFLKRICIECLNLNQTPPKESILFAKNLAEQHGFYIHPVSHKIDDNLYPEVAINCDKDFNNEKYNQSKTEYLLLNQQCFNESRHIEVNGIQYALIAQYKNSLSVYKANKKGNQKSNPPQYAIKTDITQPTEIKEQNIYISKNKKINVQIIHPDDNWILHRLAEYLYKNIPYTVSSPWNADKSKNYSINYYFNQSLFRDKIGARLSGAYFTHREPNDAEAFDRLCRNVDFCVTMCQTEFNNCHSLNPNSHLIYAGIDMEKFTPKIKLGVVGRVYSSGRKGEALWHILNSLPFVELSVTEGKLQADEIPKFYQSIDYVLITSEFEGGPMCFIEGLASGKEIISTEVGMVKDFRNNHGIYIYEKDKPQTLVNLLEQLYNKKTKLRNAIINCSIQKFVEAHDKLFRRLADAQ